MTDTRRFKVLHDLLDLEDESFEMVLSGIENRDILVLIQIDAQLKATIMSVMSSNANFVISRDLAKREKPSAEDIATTTTRSLQVANDLWTAGKLKLA